MRSHSARLAGLALEAVAWSFPAAWFAFWLDARLEFSVVWMSHDAACGMPFFGFLLLMLITGIFGWCLTAGVGVLGQFLRLHAREGSPPMGAFRPWFLATFPLAIVAELVAWRAIA